MEPTAFSTGVSIQYPTSANISSHFTTTDEHDAYLFPLNSLPKSDTEWYHNCQELAYYFVCERTRQAIQELLCKNNDTSYTQVLRFFEKYCTRVSSSSIATPPLPLNRHRRDQNAPVLFPAFHAYPTAAVITGTDATSGDLWVKPLLQTLRRTFPLCLVVPRELSSARRLIEWLAEKLADLCVAKQKEAQWMEELIEEFDLLPLESPPVAVGTTRRRLTRQEVAKTTQKVVEFTRQEKERKKRTWEEQCSDSASEASEAELQSTKKKKKQKKKKRRLAFVFYRRWTISKLLTSIQTALNDIFSFSSDKTSHQWIEILNDLVEQRLEEALHLVHTVQEKEEDKIRQSIACYDQAVMWLKRQITTCREIAPKLLNVAPAMAKPSSSSCHISTLERAFAKLLERVFHRYLSFLNECSLNRSLLNDRWQLVKQQLVKHERYYFLKEPEETKASSTHPLSPYLVLCIEQLEALSSHVWGDFLAIWTHFIRQQQALCLPHTKATSHTLGFVIGVASATAPALRRLDRTLTNHLEVQFFSLMDSQQCFHDVLETLVVKAKLPFVLTGSMLRAIIRRHDQSPSIPRLVLALRFVLFCHFRRTPWTFLALAVDDSSDWSLENAAEMLTLPRRLSSWLHRQLGHDRKLETQDNALASWLALCSDLERKDLASRVKGTVGTQDTWTRELELAIHKERRRKARWRMGWECFRSTCSWLDVQMTRSDETKVSLLVLALDGRLYQASSYVQVLQRLYTCRWALVSGMIEDWRACFRVFSVDKDDDTVATTLSELALLCAYARAQEDTPGKILTALREELVTVFTNHLILALITPGRAENPSPVEQFVMKWSVLTEANVLDERLRLNYFEKLQNLLLEAGMGSSDLDNENPSWVHDVGLAFLFYQESASATLSLHEWYESFALELKENEKTEKPTATKGKKEKKKKTSEDRAVKARFLRAFCVLRHWGFLKSDAPRDQEQDLVEKLVFI